MTARKVILIPAILAASAAVATSASADDSWRRKQVDTEQWREQAAIEQGRYKGELTRREYRQLLAEQARIAELEQRAKADGYLSSREFREIRNAQANASQHIKGETTDGQISFWRKWLYRHRY